MNALLPNILCFSTTHCHYAVLHKICYHSLSVLLQKSGKAVADLDLPPHLLNKQSTASQATSSKPPLSQQSSISGSKATVLPIPTTAQAHLTPSSKSKRAHGHSLAAQAKASDDDLPASSRASTPSSKGKQRSQDSKAVSAKPETASSPSTVRRVVPIKLDKTPRQVRQQTGPSQVPSRQSPDAAQQASASSEPQVEYATHRHQCKAYCARDNASSHDGIPCAAVALLRYCPAADHQPCHINFVFSCSFL